MSFRDCIAEFHPDDNAEFKPDGMSFSQLLVMIWYIAEFQPDGIDEFQRLHCWVSAWWHEFLTDYIAEFHPDGTAVFQPNCMSFSSCIAEFQPDGIAEFQTYGMSFSGCIAEFQPDGIAKYQAWEFTDTI